MIGAILHDEKGKVITPLSAYQPRQEVATLTNRIAQDYQSGDTLLHKPFTEFNDESLLSRSDLDQKKWNAYQLPKSSDPDEMWRWNGVRPVTRNKILAIVAHMTAKTVIPAPTAQNDKDEEDRVAAEVMRDLLEWEIRNSAYVDNYISWITDALVNPVAYLGVGFVEAMQKVKDEKGKTSEVMDAVLSGFQTYNIPIDEIRISNFYGNRNIQSKRFVIRKRVIEFDTAQALYSDNSDFSEYVHPGVRSVFDNTTSMFYDVYDETLGTLVEEVTYYNRLEDLEVTFVNGVYLGDKNVNANRIKHRDSEDRPKYAMSTLGYELISSRFFFNKSAAWKLGSDDELVQRTEQLAADAMTLGTLSPVAVTGHGALSAAMMIPGGVTTFESPDVKVQPIQVGQGISAAMQILLHAEKSMSDSSQDSQSAGVQTGTAKTAREAMILQQNARIAMGLFGSMVTNSVKSLGELMMDIILQHETVADVEEVAGKGTVEKWKTFVLNNATVGGRQVTKKIIFDKNLLGQPDMQSEEQTYNDSMALLNEEGLDGKTRIYKVNPEKWRKLKYKIVMDTEDLLPKNDLFEKALKVEVYDRLVLNPLIASDRDALTAVTRDFLVEPYTKGDADKYMPKNQSAMPMMPQGQPGQKSNLISQLTGSEPAQILGQ